MSYILIENLDDLEYLDSELLKLPYVALDTEFRRTNKDNMRLALMQINDGEEIYLIDAVSIKDPLGRCNFLSSKSVVKIIHSCKEDLESIFSWTGAGINNIFDTQIANAFLDGLFSVGYQGLVQEYLGLDINKTETRSNWLRRPLTNSQLDYAASDVEFLLDLFIYQERDLRKLGKLEWLYEEVELLSSQVFSPFFQKEERGKRVDKSEVRNLLQKFNEIVINISRQEKINETLLFSKKSQRDFVAFTIDEGLDKALDLLTSWRKSLLKEPLEEVFMEYSN